ncbi:hypothetical protein VB741_04880 [Leptothoe sp. PORK10 BA2]|nr:hypothetical protein [Leptothoe sp. PORK10 BA2]MEA5463053.1 hypothetical protein [Leptothoe sp. PORK10 BA2]
MTSQKDQIQRLIAEIDATLAKPASRLPLGLSGEAERQRQLLGKLFSYLQALEQTFDSPGGWGPIDPGTGDFVGSAQAVSPNLRGPNSGASSLEESASQVLQGLLQEMSYLRENSLKPMRQELEMLQQRRDSLQAEVSVLESQRSPDPFQSEQQINAFLETLMQRLQEQLSAQMMQNFAAMESATLDRLSAADNPVPLMTGQRLEQVRLLQAESDQLLLKLDSTLTAVFNSLQKSVDSYRESLEEGLDQMHGLGRQGEVIFHAFVNHLAQQLGQDASSYLAGGAGEVAQRAALQDPQVTTEVDLGTVQLDELDQALDDLVLDGDVGAEDGLGSDLAFDLSPDLALLGDALPSGGFDLDEDEDITVIQAVGMPDVEAELAQLEAAIASDVDSNDEEITIIQTGSGFNQVVDLEEEITTIQTDDMPDVEAELAQLEAAIADSTSTLDEPIDLDELSAGLEEDDTTLDDLGLTEAADVASEDGEPSSDGGPFLTLDAPLGDLDESLGLLAIGADSGDLLSLTAGQGALGQDALPQIESEDELFSFDANFDRALDVSPSAEESMAQFEAALFSGDSSDPIDLDADDLGAIETTFSPPAADDEPPTEADLLAAAAVADSWLFDLGSVEASGETASEGGDTPLDVLMTPSPSAVPEDTADDVLDDVTVDTLFGDDSAADAAAPIVGATDDQDTVVTSLSDLLPDEQIPEVGADFSDHVPEDVYIAAAADEDLINLVEPRAEQRLLIDFDDGLLVEQLDEDLQRLAGDTFSADYGLEEDDALEPLDQDTLENIVSDLNLEDLNLDDEPALDLVDAEAAATDYAVGDLVGNPVEELVEAPVDQPEAVTALPTSADEDVFDLFEDYAADSVDVDDPSGNDLDLAAIASLPLTDANTDADTEELDLLGLITEPLADDFEDGLPDSLADELSELSAESNALSQEAGEAVIDQFVSDLEAPVIVEDETFSVPAIDAAEPDLDSASTPDLPTDLLNDGLETDSALPDDFLQAEQAAFWQTMAEDDAVPALEDSPLSEMSDPETSNSGTPIPDVFGLEAFDSGTPSPDAFVPEAFDAGTSDFETPGLEDDVVPSLEDWPLSEMSDPETSDSGTPIPDVFGLETFDSGTPSPDAFVPEAFDDGTSGFESSDFESSGFEALVPENSDFESSDFEALVPENSDFESSDFEALVPENSDFESSGLEALDPESPGFEFADPEVFDGEDELDDGSDDLSYEMSLEAVSEDLAEDIDDLLMPADDLPVASPEVAEAALDLGDLEDLFGQSSPADLAALELDEFRQPDRDPSLDDLEELGLGNITSPGTSPEALVPLMPDVPLSGDGVVLPTIDPLVGPPGGADGVAVPVAVPPAIAPPVAVPEPPAVNLDGDWFLGLDVGGTGLSAVLMNRRTGQVYPLYWQTAPDDDTKHFRLPAMAVMTSAQDTVAVGYDALGALGNVLDASGSAELVGVNRLKPLLKVAVGHGQTLATSDPWVRWSDTVELPMLQMLQAMVALIKQGVHGGQAVGLEGDSLTQVLAKLQGVIVGYPTNWPDTYSFNLREAVLAAGLIDQPGQIVFVEDAIASVLSGLPDPRDRTLAETVSLSRQPSLYNCQWQDGMVVISGGAIMTELGLINLPQDLTKLSYGDFALRGFAYAGDALDQDIVCQLLLPEERRQPLSPNEAITTRWDWQGHLTAEDADWTQLNLAGLTLPNVGHVDWVQRYSLQHRLLGSNLGQSLLAAARHLKLALQQQNQVQITLAGQRWLIKRRHLENLIFLPYIQRINRYLNVLLSQHTADAQSIKQVLCTGGSASLPAIARWLRQKFPNATIIQDTYASELPQSCSRVAYGLVNLARYPQVLNFTRQQYSDYFLLMELLRVFPQQPLPVGAILHLLEQRGINTQACHLHILALLEGHLPPGLVPTAADRGLICDRTTDLPTYRALLQTPLFTKTITESGSHMYIPNEGQAVQLRAYLSRLLLDKVQTLEEPLIAQLETLA